MPAAVQRVARHGASNRSACGRATFLSGGEVGTIWVIILNVGTLVSNNAIHMCSSIFIVA